MYDDRRIAIHRQRRLNDETRAIITSKLMKPDTQALLLRLIDLPTMWQVSVRHVVNLGVYGGRDKVRRMFREMMLAGHMTCAPERRPDGTFERGIYMVSVEPRWFGQDLETCTDDCYADDGEKGQGNDDKPGPGDTSPVIDNSICNPDTYPGGIVENQHNPSPNKAELRQGATGHLQEAERPQAAANGSAKRVSGKSEHKNTFGDTASVRNIERLRARLIEAGGTALADVRRTPGLWRMTEITVWVMAGYSIEADILPTIRDISSRHGGAPGRVKSWRYYADAVREAHAQRTGADLSGKRPSRDDFSNPYRDPYAAPPRDTADCETWQKVSLAAALGGGHVE